MFKVTVEEVTGILDGEPELIIERYKQVVDQLNLRAVMAAVNQTPRKPRAKKTEA